MSTIEISKLKPHEYNKEVFLDLEGEDFEGLVNSISQNGLITPIIIDENNVILSGHQRVRVYQHLGKKEIEYSKRYGLNEWQKKEILISDNLNRRQLTEYQEIECYKKLKEIETEKAKDRQKEHGNTAPNKPKITYGKFSISDLNKIEPPARDKAAETLSKKTKKKKSGRTLDKQVKKEEELKQNRPDLFEQFKKGKITLNKAYSELVIDEKKKQQALEIKKNKSEIKYNLINGSIFDEIKKLDNNFDLIYVDPPYNILDEDWDKFDNEEFKEFTYKWLNAVIPKLNDKGRLYVSFSQRFMYEFYYWMDDFCKKYDLIYSNTIIWHYRNNVKAHNKKYYKYSYEPIFYFRKKNSNDLIELPDFGEERFDVWTIATPQSNYNEDKKIHPAQKPKELLQRIILTGSKPGDNILDPFAGSGTTAIVAINNNRNVTLIERDKEYCKLIKERIENECI